MDNFSHINLNKKNFKVVNVFKYLVLIFAFLFVGMVEYNEEVLGLDSLYSVDASNGTDYSRWSQPLNTKAGRKFYDSSYSGDSSKVEIYFSEELNYFGYHNLYFYVCEYGKNISVQSGCIYGTSFGNNTPDDIKITINLKTAGGVDSMVIQHYDWCGIVNWFNCNRYEGDETTSSLDTHLRNRGINVAKGLRIGMMAVDAAPLYSAPSDGSAYIKTGQFYSTRLENLHHVDIDGSYFVKPTVSLSFKSGDSGGYSKSHTLEYKISGANKACYFWYYGESYSNWSLDANTKCRYALGTSSTYNAMTSLSNLSTGAISKDSVNNEWCLVVVAYSRIGPSWDKKCADFDNEAPNYVSISAATANSWTKSKSVTLTYKDSNSKVSKIWYCLSIITTPCANNSSEWKSVSATTPTETLAKTITLSGKTGLYYLHHYAVDAAGNTSSSEKKYYNTLLKFDNTAPTLTFKASNNSFGNSATDKILTDWEDKTYAVFYPSDDVGTTSQSGYNTSFVYYKWSDNSLSKPAETSVTSGYTKVSSKTGNTYVVPFGSNIDNGKYLCVYIKDQTTDNANTYHECKKYYIDNKKPTVTVTERYSCVTSGGATIYGSASASNCLVDTAYKTRQIMFIIDDVKIGSADTHQYKLGKTSGAITGYQNKGNFENTYYKVQMSETTNRITYTVTFKGDTGKFYFVIKFADKAGNYISGSNTSGIYKTEEVTIDNTAVNIASKDDVVIKSSTGKEHLKSASFTKTLGSGYTASATVSVTDYKLIDKIATVSSKKNDKTHVEMFIKDKDGNDVTSTNSGRITFNGCEFSIGDTVSNTKSATLTVSIKNCSYTFKNSSHNANTLQEEGLNIVVVVYLYADDYTDEAGNAMNIATKYEVFEVKLDNNADKPQIEVTDIEGNFNENKMYKTDDTLYVTLEFNKGFAINANQNLTAVYSDAVVRNIKTTISNRVYVYLNFNGNRFEMRLVSVVKGNIVSEKNDEYLIALIYEIKVKEEMEGEPSLEVNDNNNKTLVDLGGNAMGYTPKDLGIKVNVGKPVINSVTINMYTDSLYTKPFAIGNGELKDGDGSIISYNYYYSPSLYMEIVIKFQTLKDLPEGAVGDTTYNISALQILGGAEEVNLSQCTFGEPIESSVGAGFYSGTMTFRCGNNLELDDSVEEYKVVVGNGFVVDVIGRQTETFADYEINIDYSEENEERIFENEKVVIIDSTTAELEYNNNEYYLEDGTKIVGNEACKLVTGVSCTKNAEEGKININNISLSPYVVAINKVVNKYGIEYLDSLGKVDIEKISVNDIGFNIELDAEKVGYLENKAISTETGKVTFNYNYFVEKGYNNASKHKYIISSLNDKFVKVVENTTDRTLNSKEYKPTVYTYADKGELKYLFTLDSSLMIDLRINVIEYDSTKVNFKLESISTCSEVDIANKKCKVSSLENKTLVVNYKVEDKNGTKPTKYNYYDSFDLALLELNNDNVELSSVSFSAGSETLTIKIKIVENKIYEDITFVNKGVVKSVTGANIAGNYEVKVISTGTIVIPADSSYEELERYDCNGKVCSVNLEGEEETVYFVVQSWDDATGKVVGRNESRDYAKSVVVEGYTFNYIIDPDISAPILQTVTGPYSYTSECSSSVTTSLDVKKGEKFCYKLTIKDNMSLKLKVVNKGNIKFIEDGTNFLFDNSSISVYSASVGNPDGSKVSEIVLVLYYRGEGDKVDVSSVKLDTETLTGAISDAGGNWLDVGSVSNSNKVNLIANNIKLVSSEFVNNTYYNNDIEVKLTFSRNVSSHELKINEKEGSCTSSGNVATCTLSVSSLSDGKVALSVKGTVTDIYGTSVTIDKSFGNVIIDKTATVIDGSLIQEGYYNSSSSFDVKLKVNEANLNTGSLDMSKIVTNTCSVEYKSLVKYSGYYVLSIRMSECTTDGDLDIDIGEGLFRDLAGNLSDAVENLGNTIKINNQSFRGSYTNADADYISSSLANNYREIEINFGRTIKSFDSSKISIISGVSANISNITKDGSKLRMRINAKSGNLNGEVVIRLLEGAVKDLHGNSSEASEEINTNVHILNGKYEVILSVNSANGCTLNGTTGKYYCVAGSTITIKGNVSEERQLVGEAGKVATLRYRIGTTYYVSTSEINSNEFTFVLTSEGEGSIYVTNLDLSEFKDMAGNSGKYSNVDLTQYIIDTTNPEFNADVYDESAPYRVNLGDAYNETTIVNLVKKAGSSDVNYYVSNNGCSLVNGRYSKLEKCTIVVTAEEISGNVATKGVVIEVNNVTSIEIKVNDREGYYGTAFIGNKVTDVTVEYIPSNLESIGVTASVVMDAIIDSNIIMSGGHSSEVGVGSYGLTLNMSSIVVNINAVPTTISINVISGNYTVKPYEITIDNINKPGSVSKTYDGSASATISGLTATGVNSETVLFEYDAVEYSDKNVGENKVYTIYGVRLSSSESNYVYSGPTTITYNNGVVRALSLDLSEVKLAEVSKYANGNTEVLQRSATYITEIGDVLTFAWSNGNYVSSEVGDSIALSLTGLVISGEAVNNYQIDKSNQPTGEILEDTNELLIEYDKESEININSDVTISVTSHNDRAWSQYETLGGSKPTYTYVWYVCNDKSNEYTSCAVESSTSSLTIDIEENNGKTLYVYSVVTNGSGNSSEAKEFIVDMNNNAFEIESIDLVSIDTESGETVKITTSTTYAVGDIVMLGVEFSNRVEEITPNVTIAMQGKYGYVYDFVCVNANGKQALCYYEVVNDSYSDEELKVIRLNNFNTLVDAYGNEFTSSFDYSNSPSTNIKIDTSAGTLDEVKFVLDGSDEFEPYRTSSLLNGKLSFVINFGNEVVEYPTSVTLTSNTSNTVTLTCMLDGTRMILTCSNETSDFSGFEGNVKVGYFGELNEQTSKVVAFSGANSLVLDDSYVANVLVYKYSNNVYVDDSELLLEMNVEKDLVKDSGYINYSFNKEYTYIEGDVTSSFEIKDSEDNIISEGITIVGEIGRLEVTSTLSGIFKISLKENNSILDSAGNMAICADTITITFDNRAIVRDGDIVFVKEGNCVDSICGLNGDIKVVVPFIREIVEVSASMEYKIGEESYTESNALVEDGKLVFVVKVSEGNGNFVVHGINVASLKDVLDDTLIGEIVVSEIDSNISVDTSGVTISGVVNSANSNYINKGILTYTVTVEEEINDLTFDINRFKIIDTEGRIYQYARVETVEKVNNTTIRVNVRVLEDAVNGSQFKLRILKNGILDIVNNELGEDYIDYTEITIDNEVPDVVISNLYELYYSSIAGNANTSVTLNLTVSGITGNGDHTKICLYNVDSGVVSKCGELVISDVTFNENIADITISTEGLENGRYQIVLGSGFVKDIANNINEEVKSNIINVSNELANIELVDFNLNSYSKEGSTTRYYYLRKDEIGFKFNITGVMGNACYYLTIYDYEGNEVTEEFECSGLIRNIELTLKEKARSDEKEYYFVIDGDVVTNEYGNTANNYNSKDVISLIVNKDEINNTDIAYDSDVYEKDGVYYTKSSNLGITYTFDTDIRRYSINGSMSSDLGARVKSVTLPPLMGEYRVLFFSHFDSELLDYSVKVVQDNEGPSVTASSDNVTHYIMGEQEVIVRFDVSDLLDVSLNGVEGIDGFNYSYENGVVTITKAISSDFNGSMDFVVPASYLKDSLGNESKEASVTVYVNEARFAIEPINAYKDGEIYYVSSLENVRFKLVPSAGVVISAIGNLEGYTYEIVNGVYILTRLAVVEGNAVTFAKDQIMITDSNGQNHGNKETVINFEIDVAGPKKESILINGVDLEEINARSLNTYLRLGNPLVISVKFDEFINEYKAISKLGVAFGDNNYGEYSGVVNGDAIEYNIGNVEQEIKDGDIRIRFLNYVVYDLIENGTTIDEIFANNKVIIDTIAPTIIVKEPDNTIIGNNVTDKSVVYIVEASEKVIFDTSKIVVVGDSKYVSLSYREISCEEGKAGSCLEVTVNSTSEVGIGNISLNFKAGLVKDNVDLTNQGDVVGIRTITIDNFKVEIVKVDVEANSCVKKNSNYYCKEGFDVVVYFNTLNMEGNRRVESGIGKIIVVNGNIDAGYIKEDTRVLNNQTVTVHVYSVIIEDNTSFALVDSLEYSDSDYASMDLTNQIDKFSVNNNSSANLYIDREGPNYNVSVSSGKIGENQSVTYTIVFEDENGVLSKISSSTSTILSKLRLVDEEGVNLTSEVAEIDSLSLSCASSVNESGKFVCTLKVVVDSKSVANKFRLVIDVVVKDIAGNENEIIGAAPLVEINTEKVGVSAVIAENISCGEKDSTYYCGTGKEIGIKVIYSDEVSGNHPTLRVVESLIVGGTTTRNISYNNEKGYYEYKPLSYTKGVPTFSLVGGKLIDVNVGNKVNISLEGITLPDIVIDNEEYKVEFTSGISRVQNVAVITYSCNKVSADCGLVAGNILVTLDGEVLNEGVVIDGENKTITVTTDRSGILLVGLKENHNVVDYSNNKAKVIVGRVEIDNNPVEIEDVKISLDGCKNNNCPSGSTINLVVTFNKEISEYNAVMVVKTTIGDFVFDSKVSARQLRFRFDVKESTVNGLLVLNELSHNVSDDLGNIMLSLEINEETGIVIDTMKPIVAIENLTKVTYNSSESEALTISVDDGDAEINISKVCLKQGTYTNCRSSAITYSEGEWRISFANLKGTYQIVILEGFASDGAGNKSSEVITQQFTVTNDRDTLELKDINYTTGIAESGGTTYYYFDVVGGKTLDFNIVAGSKTYTGNACSYITFYKNDGTVTNLFNCIDNGSKNIQIVYNTSSGEEVDLVNGYYFVINGAAIVGENTLSAIDYNSSNKIRLMVSPSMEISKQYSTNNIVSVVKDGIINYYIKGTSSLNITFNSNVYIQEYSFDNIPHYNVRALKVTLTGLIQREGQYTVILKDYLGNTYKEDFVIYKDNVKPVVDITLDEFTNSNEVTVGYECSDTGDNLTAESSSGIDCNSREVKVYLGTELLVEGTDYELVKDSVDSIKLLDTVFVSGNKIKVEYSLSDTLGNKGIYSKVIVVDTEAPGVNVELNNKFNEDNSLGPVSNGYFEIVVSVSDEVSGLLINEIEYGFTSDRNNAPVNTKKVELVRGKVVISMKNEDVLNGIYHLYIKGISDKANNVSDDYYSEEIIFDNEGLHVDSVVLSEGCNLVGGVYYCNRNDSVKGLINLSDTDGYTATVKSNKASGTIDLVTNTINLVIFGTATNSEEVTLNVKLVDNAGNVVEEEYVISNLVIDVTKDVEKVEYNKDNEIKANPTNITSIVITDDGLSPIFKKEYSLNGGEYVEFKDEDFKNITLNSTSTIAVRVTDASGNVYVSGKTTITVDTTPPTFTVAIKDGVTTLTNYSLNEKVKVVISSKATDVASYCVGFETCIPASDWASYGDVEIELTEGKNVIGVVLKDIAGNSSEVLTKEIYYINPRFVNNNSDETRWYNNYNIKVEGLNENFTSYMSYGLLEQDASIYNEAYNRSVSNIKGNEYELKGSANYNGVYKLIAKVSIGSNRSYVKELVVNNLRFDTLVSVDNSTIDYEKEWTNEDVKVLIDVFEDVSGIKEAKLMIRNYQGDFVVDSSCVFEENMITLNCMVKENGKYKIKVIDNANNEVMSDQFEITRIDREGYSIRIKVDNEDYQKDHEVEMLFSGENALISEIRYILLDAGIEVTVDNFGEVYNANAGLMDVIYGSVDNSSSSIIRTIKDVTGTYKMHVYTKDAAGNIVVESKEILLDNRAPEVEFKEFNNVYASYKTQASFETLFSVSDNHVGTVGSVVYSLIDGSGNEYKDIFTTYVDSEFKECILGVDKDCKLIVERLEGEYNVKILAQDTLGNSVEAMSSNKLLVDNYGPRVTRTNPDLHNAIPNYKVEDISEISSVKYCYSTISRDELAECTTEANLVNNEFSIEGLNVDITIYLRIITIDELGNENILDSEIAFDDMPPEIKVDVCVGSDDCAEENKNQYYVEEEGNHTVITTNKLTNANIYLEINVEDLISGLKCSYVVIGTEDITSSMDRIGCAGGENVVNYTITMNSYVNVFAIDNAGNISTMLININTINKNTVEFNADYLYKEGYVQENEIEINLGNVLVENIVSVEYKYLEYFAENNRYIDSELYSDGYEGTITTISTIKDVMSIANIKENGIYVVKVVDKWGNVAYRRVIITNIDTENPEFIEGANFKLKGDNAFENVSGVYSKVDSNSITENQEFIYKGRLTLSIPVQSVKDDVRLIKVGFGIRVRICYGGEYSEDCETYNITLDSINGENTAIVEIPLRENYSGQIAYKLVDLAGNSSEKIYMFNINNLTSHEIKINSEIIDKDGNKIEDKQLNENYYSNIGVDLSIEEDTNGTFEKVHVYLLNHKDYSTKVCEQMITSGNEYTLTCGELDGIYDLMYEIHDILGNVSEPQLVKSMKLDNISPENKSDLISFKLSKAGENFTLKYNLSDGFDQTSIIKVFYSDDTEYCTIDRDMNNCGNIDLSKYNGNQYTFKTKVIDKAGNVSKDSIGYEFTYNGLRSLEVYEDYIIEYDSNKTIKAKKIVVTINVDKPTGNVKNVDVYSNNVLVASLGSRSYDVLTVVANGQYTLTISEDTYEKIFGEEYPTTGIVNKTLLIKVYDEDPNDDNGQEAGFVGEEEINVNYNMSTPKLTFDSVNPLDITTIKTENTYKFTSSKSLSNIRYIFERKIDYSNTVYVTTFDNIYDSCLNNNRCVSGDEVSSLGENTYSFNIESNNLLDTGRYRIIVYGEDEEGHKFVKVFGEEIKVDNTAPIVSIDITPLSIEDPIYKIFDSSIKLTISDNFTYTTEYNSKLKSLVVYTCPSVSECEEKDEEGNVILPIKRKQDNLNSGSLEVKIGNDSGGIEDGYYLIVATDNRGHETREHVIVDTDNLGFNYNIDEAKYSKDALKDLAIIMLEDMKRVEIEFYTLSNTNLRMVISNNGDYTLCNNVSGRLVCEETKHTNISIGTDSEISIKSLLEMIEDEEGNAKYSIESLSSKIKEMRVTVTNVSNKKVYKDKVLDFDNPVITVKENAQYTVNRERILRYNEDKVVGEYNCSTAYCYSLSVPVMVNKQSYEIADELMDIVALFIGRVDVLTYSEARKSERLFITYTDGTKFNTSENSWESWNILDVVGEYILRFDYSDDAGNKAEPVFLVLNVKDNVKPTIKFNNTSLKATSILEISSIEGANYKDEGLVGSDTYGFNVEGTTKTTSNYNLYYSLDGKEVKFELDEVSGKYVLKVEGKVYAEKIGNIYKFYKKGTYVFSYEVVDFAGNKVQKDITVNVVDKHAPIIDDGDNTINIENSLYLDIDGERYTIVDDEEGLRLVDSSGNKIEIINNIFEIDGKRYELKKEENKVYYVLNIDNGKVCFGEGENCEKILNNILASDKESGTDTVVDISKVEYSTNGSRYTTADKDEEYVVDLTEGIFKVKGIKFNLVGYYRVTFYTVDANNNRREIQYIFKVEDTTGPVFMLNEKEVEGTEEIKVEYTKEFEEKIKPYRGSTVETKTENYLKAWIKEVISLKQNYEKDANLSYTIEEVVLVSADTASKEYMKFRIVLTAKDSSNNITTLTIMYVILDNEAPTNGNIKISYDGKNVAEINGQVEVNADDIYFSLTGASDITNNIRYEYKVVIDGNVPSSWEEYIGGWIKAYTSVSNQTHTVQIIYRVVDGVGNVSEEKNSENIVIDKKNVTVEVKAIDEENVNVEEIYKGNGRIKLTFRDDRGKIEVVGYRNNKEITRKMYASDDTYTVQGFGHYKFVARDLAGNEVIKEFIIMPSDKKYSLIDNKLLGDANNSAIEEKQFDEVILQKLSSSGNEFYFEDMGIIANNDSVYMLGVVPDNEGTVFSIYPSGAVGGVVFKGAGDVFPINTTTNITGINPGYEISDYIINYKGDKYILIGIEKGTYTGPGATDEEKPNGGNSAGNKNASGSSMGWMLYVLGGVGAIGGVFLIMKLRKKVRAA